jgi:tetratricopeptide (TPR) repeat protein
MAKPTVNPNDQWLIKSAGRVMGPFKLNEVTTGLHLKHFTVLDEISLPYGRWILIRDEPALQEAIKDVRKKEDFVERTVTQTENMSKSQTITANYVHMQEEQFESAGPGSPPPLSREQRIRQDLQMSSDPQVKAMVKKRAMVLPLFIVVLILVFSGGAYFFLNKKGGAGNNASESLMLQVLNYKGQGLYEKAIDLLNKIKANDKNNTEAEVEAAFIQIGQYSQTLVGRRTLEKYESKYDDAKYGPQLFTSVALSYLLEGDWKNADENLQKALKLDPQFTPAIHNNGVLNYRSGQYEKAEKDFENIISANPNNPYILLGSALSSLEVHRKGGSPVRIMPVLVQLLDSYLKDNFDLEQEILMAQAYIYTQINNAKARASVIARMLNGDLDSGRNHKFDILFDKSVVGWKNLLPYCQVVYESAQRDPLNKSLWAYCLYRAGNDIDSRKAIYEVVAENPTHPQASYVKSYLMNILGQAAEAKVTLNTALADKNNKGALMLRANFCEQEHNEACVADVLMQLLDTDPRLINGYVGLAKLETRKGNKKGALEWVNRGMGLTSTYLPLLELKNSLSQ